MTDAHAPIVTQFRKAVETSCEDTMQRWKQATQSDADSAPHCDAEVARFLAALTIKQGQLQRDHVAFAAPAMYVKPILDRLSSTGSAEAVWAAVIGPVPATDEIARAVARRGLPIVDIGGGTAGAVPSETKRMLAARTVTMLDIHTAISTALAVPGGYEPVPPMVRSSRLEVKMDVGGCSGNAIERALSVRSDYQDYLRDRESTDSVRRGWHTRCRPPSRTPPSRPR